MSLSVSGLVTGLDTDNIISQLMAIERRPITLLQQKEMDFQVKLSSYGILKSTINDFNSSVEALKDVSAFETNKVIVSDEDILTATVSDDAISGTYNIEVKELARAEKVKSISFSSQDDAIGTGNLTIQVGSDDPIDIEITEENNTLEGIAKAINDADSEVSAGIIKEDDNNFYLLLSSSKTGAANTISVSATSSDGLDILENLTVNQSARDAKFTLDGIQDILRPSNTIDDVISGITLNLKEKNIGDTITVTVEKDYNAIKNKIQSFVDSYNSTVDSFSSAQSYDDETKRAGALLGDVSTNIMRNKVRSLMSNIVSDLPDDFNSLNNIGIEIDSDGRMSIDSSKLDEVLKNNIKDVQNLFTQNDEGIAIKVSSYLDSILDSSEGVFAAKENSITGSIDNIHDDIDSIGQRLVKREQNLQRQFLALETLMGEMQATSNFLTQQLDGLANLSTYLSNR